MSFSEFFIGRPIFAGVISIIITIAGLIASQVLPIAQYPEIAPPTVVITANYPGASAETLARTVAAPIEEQLSGVENLIYFSSTASTNGTLSINCTFEVGSNADKAVIDVNNRVAIALPRLPDVVRQSGVVAQKRSTDILLVIALTSSDPRYDTLYLSNYATINLLDELKRHATQAKYQLRLKYGVGDVVIWDNASLLHSATLIDPNDPRTLWRITIKEERRP